MIEEKIIPMTYDKMFKSVLKSKEAREYLIDIIGEITGLPKEKIRKDIKKDATGLSKEELERLDNGN